MAPPSLPVHAKTPEIAVERYKYILTQINATNENMHKFLALYQTLATALTTAALAVFVFHKQWMLAVDDARLAVIGILVLLTIVGVFTILMMAAGLTTWLDYRREECELVDKWFSTGFRSVPNPWNFWRWHESYMIILVVAITGILWFLGTTMIIPRIV